MYTLLKYVYTGVLTHSSSLFGFFVLIGYFECACAKFAEPVFRLAKIRRPYSTRNIILQKFQVHIKVLDINDHSPVFTQKVYKSTIAENLQLNPPAAILQVLAEDKDEGINAKVQYRIVEQTEPGKYNSSLSRDWKA